MEKKIVFALVGTLILLGGLYIFDSYNPAGHIQEQPDNPVNQTNNSENSDSLQASTEYTDTFESELGPEYVFDIETESTEHLREEDGRTYYRASLSFELTDFGQQVLQASNESEVRKLVESRFESYPEGNFEQNLISDVEAVNEGRISDIETQALKGKLESVSETHEGVEIVVSIEEGERPEIKWGGFSTVWSMETSDFSSAPDCADYWENESQPYQVENVYDLQCMNESLSADYELANGIDASDTDDWNSGSGFDPVGSNSEPFNGSFFGRYNRIENLSIIRPGENRVGLFSYVTSPGKITRVGMINVNIHGNNYTGSIVGDMYGGLIQESFSKGVLEGNNDVGGLFGKNFGGKVNYSYSKVDVSGIGETGYTPPSSPVQGLGAIDARLNASFSTGAVDASDVGFCHAGSGYRTRDVGVAYCDAQSAGVSTASDVTGLDTDQMLGDSASENMDFDFSSEGLWMEIKGERFVRGPLQSADYPYLRGFVEPKWYFPDGEGTSSDPYEIETCQQLQNMNKDLDAHYELVQNIDCINTTEWNYNSSRGVYEGFDPIGPTYETNFNGSLDGRGNIIKDLYMNRSQSQVGLFGENSDSSDIYKLGLINVSITGNGESVGVVADSNSGAAGPTIREIFVTGSIRGGPGAYLGNFGSYAYYQPMENVYSLASLKSNGADSVGGLTGSEYTTQRTSYYAGNIEDGTADSGGLTGGGTGYPYGGETSYWDIQVSGVGSDPGYSSEGLTTSQMTGLNAKGNLDSFDFQNTWQTVSTEDSYSSDGYPILRNVNKTVQLREQGIVQFAGGKGTDADPFEINSCQMLQNMDYNLTASYELVQDIDCSDTENWNNGQGFDPLGGFDNYFNGSLDGNGASVSGLYSNGPDSRGMFSYIGEPGEVSNLKISSFNITSTDPNRFYAGGVAGVNYGNITNISAKGEIDGYYAGIIVGDDFGAINHVRVDGEVEPGFRVGGIAGRYHGNISDSFSLAAITAGYSYGPLIGSQGTGANEMDLFYDSSEASTGSAVGTGLTTSEMQGQSACNNMDGLDFENVWTPVNGDYPDLQVFAGGSGISCNSPPSASFSSDFPVRASEDFGLDASGSSDPDGDSLSYGWDTTGDGNYDDATGVSPSVSKGEIGNYAIGLRVSDGNGASDTISNTVPVVPSLGTILMDEEGIVRTDDNGVLKASPNSLP